ncbi:galactose-specific lectin nattectin [Austrofundulus limnaeus]|uniref:Galactose-specific lectin nattectin n=1 Tax=Austrofundulus limnaeus TaxID=52670 RepID=A0A2I4D064_AUSLI|nr:PREDICTED: galactose-specific lectin nattectin-like [Austrofundulus limnaeus]
MASSLFFTLLFCLNCGLLVEAHINWFLFPKVTDCTCPVGWNKYKGRCYVFIADELMWSDAENCCIKKGGNLASFHNYDEYKYIMELVNTETGSYKRTWVGGCDAANEGVWLWSDGSKFDYPHWGTGQPNNAGRSEDCMEINLHGQDNVNDVRCFYKRPFICAKTLQKCSTCP